MADALSIDDMESLAQLTGERGVSPAVSTRTSGDAAHQPHGRTRTVRTMDFARPSKFNKDQLRTLHMLHEGFCRRASTYLSGSVRSLVEVSVTGAEQVSYGDFVTALPVPTFTSVLEVAPLGTNAMAAIDLPLLFAMLDRMLGGPGTTASRTRELTEIESSLASNLMTRLLAELSGSWSDLVPVEFRLRGIEMNAQFAQIVPASEPSVLITMELSIGTATGDFAICFPYRSIEQVVSNLTAHRYFATGDEEPTTRTTMADNLTQVQMPVRAEVGRARLPLETVLDLKPGDVIPLGRRTEDGVRLVVGNTHAYRALPGRDGNRLAVQIVERIEGGRA